ncbi:hypothetical protein DEE69_24950 [Ralstonia insidiosa]|nr:hypothetical protein [Ralstonia insidiosa]MBA9939345.1 hypothetical protein [Ralstonia insidiosa]MBC9968115.1 hypothetical protein [Ralstonia insidiosa]MBX3904322.1 hypothetical protein [Ralstonia insidiosa]
MNVKRPKAIASLALAVLSVILALWVGLPSWLVTLGVLAALFSLTACLRGMASDRNLRAIEGALNDLDVITGGLRIIGRDAEVVDWRRADLPTEPGPIEVAQLCRTKKGQWFEHRFELRRSGRIYGNRVTLLSNSDARGWLSYNVKAYERVFGKAEVA